jgi:hypothetical protein
MKTTAIRISHTVSAMLIAGLLGIIPATISTSLNSTSQNICEYTQSFQGGRIFPKNKYDVQELSNDVWRRIAARPKYEYTQNFQDDWCSTESGMHNFAP